MNERIQQLAYDAQLYVELYGKPWPRAMSAEEADAGYKKFAELIVQECTQLLFDESERLYAYSSECNIMRDSEEVELCAEKCIDNIEMIEKHFGVE